MQSGAAAPPQTTFTAIRVTGSLLTTTSCPPILRQHPVEQLLQRFVVALQAVDRHAVVVRQREERPRLPARRRRHAQPAPLIVLDDADPFKQQLLAERARIALDV